MTISEDLRRDVLAIEADTLDGGHLARIARMLLELDRRLRDELEAPERAWESEGGACPGSEL